MKQESPTEEESMPGAKRTLAEFSMILVGVFLALAAERWVSERSERALMSQYTTDLADDLRNDSAQHAAWTLLSGERISGLRRLLEDLNGVSPPLAGAEELAVLYYAQLVPVPEFQRATYSDLIGSGNVRLLEPTLRRSLIRYHARLEATDQGVALTGLGKPVFADVVPALTRAALTARCAGQPYECGRSLTDSLWSAMPAAEQVTLSSWREMPEIRLELQRVLNQAHAFERGFTGVGPALWDVLTLLEQGSR